MNREVDVVDEEFSDSEEEEVNFELGNMDHSSDSEDDEERSFCQSDQGFETNSDNDERETIYEEGHQRFNPLDKRNEVACIISSGFTVWEDSKFVDHLCTYCFYENFEQFSSADGYSAFTNHQKIKYYDFPEYGLKCFVCQKLISILCPRNFCTNCINVFQ